MNVNGLSYILISSLKCYKKKDLYLHIGLNIQIIHSSKLGSFCEFNYSYAIHVTRWIVSCFDFCAVNTNIIKYKDDQIIRMS